MTDRTAFRELSHGRVAELACDLQRAHPLCGGQKAPCGASCVCWQAASMEATKQRRAKISEVPHG